MRDSSREFPAIDDPEEVTGLRVWFCQYRTLEPLAQFTNLTTLVIAGYPDANFAAIAGLARLEYLSIMHLPKITDLAPLSSLKSLRTLRLQTLPGWDGSGKVTVVDSYEPLSQLPRLEHLELLGVGTADRSLGLLESAPALTSLLVQHPTAEVDRFRSATGVTDRSAPPPNVSGWY